MMGLDSSVPEPYPLCWCRTVSHGSIAAVALPEPKGAERLPDVLTSEERDHALSLKPIRRVSWVGGRVALRLAARQIGWELPSIGATPRGAPRMPNGLVGSLAHKTRMAVALVDAPDDGTVGIDLEELDRPRPVIAKLVLRPEERAVIEALPEADRWQAIVLRFSIKEAIFKALDPYVQRYIGFREARVEPRDDGGAKVSLLLEQGEGPFEIDARWWIEHEHVFTTLRATQIHSER